MYLVDYPRSGDTNNNGEWGHGNLNYMNGWKGLSTKYTGLRAMGSYSGNIAYCIEPGTGQRTGDTLTEKDENFFNNISPKERFPAMTFACLSVVSCSTATVEVFRQAGSRRMKETQTASHTLMPLRF